ncbi:FtsW/RodA/SpoVE family cell cycle protein [Balneolaceae bacterium ANBcel3]|nr:FtsW/RodA/SpoVE family cell cycle protein [Balneolaceae bacterium ANBcel3]
MSQSFTNQYLFEQPYNGNGSSVAAGPSDRWILAAVFLLMVAGLLAVYSSIAYFATTKGTTASAMVIGHAAKLVISLFVIIFVSKIKYEVIAEFSSYVLLLSWFFLIIVTLHGTEVFGARRSLSIGGFSFQPSSMAVVALLMHVASKVSKKQDYIHDFMKTVIPLMVWIVGTAFLIALEDFSTAALLVFMCFMIMFIGRVKLSHILAFVLIGVIGGGAILAQSAERQSRVTNYVTQIKHVESSEFQLGSGYQTQQSQIAIARGGVFGVGIGKSTQRDFLPAPYNDFIFSIIVEEYGLIGVGYVLILYLVILFRGMIIIARRAKDPLAMLMAVGCTLGITMYAFVNAGVAVGLLPVTGLPMPFISFGGTSMLFSGIMVGVLLQISKRGGSAYA